MNVEETDTLVYLNGHTDRILNRFKNKITRRSSIDLQLKKKKINTAINMNEETFLCVNNFRTV